MALTVKFWGTRGSTPCPPSTDAERRKLANVLLAATPEDIADTAAVEAFIDSGCNGALSTRYGGNTACVEVRADSGERLLIDFGSGSRVFANETMANEGPQLERPLDVLLSHLHWDHIQGFPFFGLSFVPGNKIRIHGCHDGIEQAFRQQMATPFFPVPFDLVAGNVSFDQLAAGETAEIGGFNVTPFLLPHPGGSYGYRIELGGHVVVYASDAEHKPEDVRPDYPYVDFIRDADILIFDAQYSLAEMISIKEDWGHSSNVIGVELAQLGGVKQLVFFHHEPLSPDDKLDEMLENARVFEDIMREGGQPVSVISAWDGLEMTLD